MEKPPKPAGGFGGGFGIQPVLGSPSSAFCWLWLDLTIAQDTIRLVRTSVAKTSEFPTSGCWSKKGGPPHSPLPLPVQEEKRISPLQLFLVGQMLGVCGGFDSLGCHSAFPRSPPPKKKGKRKKSGTGGLGGRVRVWTWAGETRFSPDRNLDDSLPKSLYGFGPF